MTMRRALRQMSAEAERSGRQQGEALSAPVSDEALGPRIGNDSLGINLYHYAGQVWDGSHRGAWQLYGHSHGALDNHPARRGSLSVDVGVDSWGMYPVSLEQIADVMAVKRGERDGGQSN